MQNSIGSIISLVQKIDPSLHYAIENVLTQKRAVKKITNNQGNSTKQEDAAKNPVNYK